MSRPTESAPNALNLAASRLSGWGGVGGGWSAQTKVFKPDLEARREAWSSGGLTVCRRAGVEETAGGSGIRRFRSWSRNRVLVAVPQVKPDSDVAAALAMARLSGPEYPLLMLVCAEQWQHLPTVQRYAQACGLEPIAAMDALERILWRRAAISIDQRAKQLGMRAASYRQRTRQAEAMFLRWLDRAASAFLTAHNNSQ